MTIQSSQAIDIVWPINKHERDEGLLSFAIAPVVLLGDRPPLVIPALPAVFLVVWGGQHVQHGRTVRAGDKRLAIPIAGVQELQRPIAITTNSGIRLPLPLLPTPSPPPLPPLLIFDAPIRFRFGRACKTE